MGTDIHLAAEVRNDEGEWELVPGPIIDCWACHGTGIETRWKRVHSTTEQCNWCTNDGSNPDFPDDDGSYYRRKYVGPGKTRDSWYSDRNYTVFAILGNVRNGHGFAGVYTHDPLPFISDCRGVPDDATPEALEHLSNEHSATWCTLAEVMDYPWHAPIHRGGVITIQQYARLRGTGAAPTNWCGGIDGRGIMTLTPQAADMILAQHPRALSAGSGHPSGPFRDDSEPINGIRYYVNYEWDDTLADTTRGFLDRMKMLAMEVGEHDCRLIFDFDS
jgi:hypothetical protein